LPTVSVDALLHLPTSITGRRKTVPSRFASHWFFKLLGRRAIPAAMTVEDIEEAILRLPPAELAKFRAWFAEFEAGRVNKKSEPEDTASRLGRIAGRTFADLRKRLREP
jgi:hypothetical protein